MFTFTDATALTTIRAYGKRTDAQTLKVAAAFAFYRKSHSLNETVAAQSPEAPLSRTRVNTLVKAFESAPADVTPEDFAAHVKASTDANRASKAPAEPAEDTSSRGGKSERTAAAEHTVTLEEAIRELYVLGEAFGSEAAFRAALADVLDLNAPIVLVATPVAA